MALVLFHGLKFQLTHPWGCDRKLPEETIFTGNFNSHTREGVTWYNRPWLNFHQLFQLTHPWGCDHLHPQNLKMPVYFNSHTREGVTLYIILHLYQYIISTHTPVRVWPGPAGSGKNHTLISTHTPVRVWRYINFSACRLYFISTHTPVRVWLFPKVGTVKFVDFNSHTREGVTYS